MKNILPLLLVFCVGCGSTSNKLCSGDPLPWEELHQQAVTAELRRQLEYVGEDGDFASIQQNKITRIEPEMETKDGKAGTLPVGIEKPMVHAAFSGRQGVFSTQYWFASCESDEPDMRHVSHEVLHNLLIVYFGIGGHPTEFDLNGKEYTSEEIILGGARWPQKVWRVLTPWKKRTLSPGFREVVNGDLLVDWE